MRQSAHLAGGETVILLHPPLPLVGVSIETMRECQQSDSLVDGCAHRHREHQPPEQLGQYGEVGHADQLLMSTAVSAQLQ